MRPFAEMDYLPPKFRHTNTSKQSLDKMNIFDRSQENGHEMNEHAEPETSGKPNEQPNKEVNSESKPDDAGTSADDSNASQSMFPGPIPLFLRANPVPTLPPHLTPVMCRAHQIHNKGFGKEPTSVCCSDQKIIEEDWDGSTMQELLEEEQPEGVSRGAWNKLISAGHGVINYRNRRKYEEQMEAYKMHIDE
uniref:MADF domain-containing protein n=1 Tax=Caenorhabditis tropicalis TaxID=1561998 RepID=A0A1I7UPN8_9PELO